MKSQYFKGLVEKKSEGGYRVIASTAAVDRQGDVIDQNGWLTDNYMKNPVMLFAHDYSSLPVAKCTGLEIKDQSLIASFEFAPAEANPQAGFIKSLYDNGFMSAVSVGFIPKEQNGNIITKAELLEISFVPVPANQEALALSYKSLEDNIELSADFKANFKKSMDLFSKKGEVADELTAEEQAEQKWEKWGEVCEVLNALWTVYFNIDTPVEDFSKLLTEAIDLLDTVAGNDGADDDEAKSIVGKKRVELKGEMLNFMQKTYEFKAGRELSAKNIEKISKALEHATNTLSVLEDLKTSAQSEDGEKALEVVVEKTEVLEGNEVITIKSSEMIGLIRKNLVASGETHDLAMKLLNGFIDKKGKK